MSGATGTNAYLINGAFMATEETLNGRAVFQKADNKDRWVIYSTTYQWHVTDTESKEANDTNCTAYCTDINLVLPTLATSWEVIDGNGFDTQTVQCSALEVTTHTHTYIYIYIYIYRCLC